MEHVKNRNADFEHIYNQMSFGRVMRTNVTVVANAAAGGSLEIGTWVSPHLDVLPLYNFSGQL